MSMPPAALAMISGRRAARSFVTARYSSPRMSAAGSTSTVRTAWPRMSMPRISPAAARASAADRQSFTPPALPRPPVSTCAFTTDRRPEPFGGCGGLLRRGRHVPARDRNAVALEALLCLEFVKIHGESVTERFGRHAI